MTQQETINAAFEQLPDPTTFLGDKHYVDFNYKDGSTILIVGFNKIYDWDNMKNLPMRVHFVKKGTNKQDVLWILDPMLDEINITEIFVLTGKHPNTFQENVLGTYSTPEKADIGMDIYLRRGFTDLQIEDFVLDGR